MAARVISRPHHVYNEDRNKIACANVTYYVIYDHAKRERHHRSAGVDLRGDGMSAAMVLWLLAGILAASTLAIVGIAWACRNVRDEGGGPWWD